MQNLKTVQYGVLSESPTLSPIPKYSIPEKVEKIIELARITQAPYYYKLTGKTLTTDPQGFQAYVRSKYITEEGEIFRHPVRFIQFNGDCDDQTIFFLANWFSENAIFKNIFPVEILIVQSKKFLHITQKYGGKIFDFLPYKWPPDVRIIYRKTVN